MPLYQVLKVVLTKIKELTPKVITLRILLIDDDPLQLELVQEMLNHNKWEDWTAANSYEDGVKILGEQEFDLVISDFALGTEYTALDVLQNSRIDESTGFIVMTNHYEEAVYEKLLALRPFIFLKKGFSILELKQAVEYIMQTTDQKESTASNGVEKKDKFYVKVGNKYKIVQASDIEYMVIDGKYLDLHLADAKYSIRSSILEILNLLPENFIRVHGSFIVNIEKVESIIPSDQTVQLLNHEVPFSRNYRKELLDRFLLK